MRIINLRGTSGSGKTYIVKRIMELYATKTPHMIERRKQPIGYTLTRPDGNPLFLAGHYEGACGGCDNLSQGLDYIYGLIHEATARGEDVMFEGLIVASDVLRCIELKQRHGHELMVIGLNTSLPDCLAGVQQRRDARGDTRPLSSKNTEAKFKALIPQRIRFKDAGIDFRLLDRAAALNACLGFLGHVSNGNS